MDVDTNDLLFRFNTGENFIEQPMFPIEIGSPPEGLERRSGACIVLGTHPCYREDLIEALCAYPDAEICGVNEAGKLIQLDHLATCHGDKLGYFLECCDQSVPPVIHTRANTHAKHIDDESVNKWEVRTMAGSAPFAATIMVLLGYDIVIMCGCPMDGGGGYAFKDTHRTTRDDPRIGEVTGSHSMIKAWHRVMRLYVEEYPEITSKIRSMSGITKEIFGGLDG